MGALALRVQFPGPRSGTSTDSKPGPSVPESSPLKAFAFGVGAAGLTVVVVAAEKLFSTDAVPVVVCELLLFEVTTIGVVGLVAFVALLGVDVLGTDVVTGDVEEGGSDEAAGTCGADAEVRVKTSTRRSSGLDHIKRWALFSEKGERGMVFVG